MHRLLIVQTTTKGTDFPLSLPSVGSGADPDVQTVSPQVTISHPPDNRLPLLSTRPAVTFSAASLPLGRYQVILLGDRSTCVNNLPKIVMQLLPRVGFELMTC